MGSKFFFSLSSLKPQKGAAGGNVTQVTSDEVPGLVNISFVTLSLDKQGVMEPIWHPNANKIGYSVQGDVVVSIRSPQSSEVFTVKKGEIFFIPRGYIHHIQNVGDEQAVIHFALDNTKPETMFLSKAVKSISESVFTSTFKSAPGFIDGLNKGTNEDLIKAFSSSPANAKFIPSRFKFDIEESDKAILTKGGYVQLGTKTNLPVLDGLGILGFGLNPKGIVEPHWHTNAGELVYIVKGKTRITVLSPDGKAEIMDVNGGEGAFAPASHFHNIENVGDDNVEVIAFFSHADPDYIGIGEVVGSYSNELLGSVFNVQPGYFDAFKKPSGPLVIVPV